MWESSGCRFFPLGNEHIHVGTFVHIDLQAPGSYIRIVLPKDIKKSTQTVRAVATLIEPGVEHR